MALEHVKTELEKLAKDNPELDYKFIVEAITASGNAEMEKGKKLVNARNAENKGLQAFKKAVVGLGFDAENGKLDEFVADVSGKVAAGTEGEAAKTELGSLKSDIGKLTSTVGTLKTKLDESETQRTDLLAKNRNQVIQTTLLKAMDDKIYGADAEIFKLVHEKKVGLAADESTVVFKDGDNEVALQEGVDKFIEDHPGIVKSQQTGGAGSSGASGEGSPAATDGMSKEDKEFAENWKP